MNTRSMKLLAGHEASRRISFRNFENSPATQQAPAAGAPCVPSKAKAGNPAVASSKSRRLAKCRGRRLLCRNGAQVHDVFMWKHGAAFRCEERST